METVSFSFSAFAWETSISHVFMLYGHYPLHNPLFPLLIFAVYLTIEMVLFTDTLSALTVSLFAEFFV